MSAGDVAPGPSAAADSGARRRAGVPAAGDDRALGLRAALRLHRRAHRDVPRRTAASTGGSCCSSPSRWWGCAPSPWPRTGSSTARSTPVTRAPPAANWSPARCRVRTAWTGALVAVVVFLGAGALLNPLCLALAPVAVIPMVVYPYGKRFTDFPHAILGLAQAIGPDRRLDRRHRRLVVGRGGPRPGRRRLDRRLRPDLRLPGRRGRPRAGRALRPRPLRHRRRRCTGRAAATS